MFAAKPEQHPIEKQGAACSTHIAIRWGTALAVLYVRRCERTNGAMLSIPSMQIVKQNMVPYDDVPFMAPFMRGYQAIREGPRYLWEGGG